MPFQDFPGSSLKLNQRGILSLFLSFPCGLVPEGSAGGGKKEKGILRAGAVNLLIANA